MISRAINLPLDPAQALRDLAGQFPGWKVWRPRVFDGEFPGWAATRLGRPLTVQDNKHGLEETLFSTTPDDLKQRLTKQTALEKHLDETGLLGVPLRAT
ncbi:hypothetical protein DPM19_23350 [Actinomadura craniellae]|uniref:Uncharacterized protein n=1 Tax=Actinomadura craniellae TaxID=2231787 RepID=A0A365H1P4_9ACTN|nr:hypothetical protein [Actinomadura craniellae]RAY12946.1 hypothetical protein DPM19_23350 [Actinomadura craniellae]